MGRPQHSTPGTSGGGQTVAVNQRPQVQDLVITETATIAAGNTETTEVYAPTGSLYHLKAFRAEIFAESTNSPTSGTHALVGRTAQNVYATKGEAAYNSPLIYKYGYWKSADSLQEPPNNENQLRVVQQMLADENKPIRLVYQNNTDAARADERAYRFTFEEESY